MLTTEYVAPFVWAGATAVVLVVTWILRNAVQKGIGDIVDAKLEPFNRRLKKVERRRDHLQAVEPVEEENEQ